MKLKHFALSLIALGSLQVNAQDSADQLAVKPQFKSYLDSIKSTFVHDDMASCVDSLWLKELAGLDLYNDITSDITKFNFEEKVDYELSTELLKERLKKLDAKSPFNIEYNPGLENLIKSFLKNRKRSFERLMAISEYYFPMFEEALARQNVPLEIKYLAVVESALNPKAVSRVGATGLWQFMYQTGKQYNLGIDSYVDERSDPLKASDAAAQYLSNMYRIFGDWDLVLASYNSGPGNVAKAIRRSGGRQNYWNIRKFLPKETQGYVPAFLATMYIYEYHKEHGIVPERALVKHFATDTVAVKRELTFKQLSDLLDMPVAQLQMLNPSFKRNAVPVYPEKYHFLRLPQDKIALFTSNEDKIYAYADYEHSRKEKPFTRLASVARERDSSDTDAQDVRMATVAKTKYYKVRRGDNLSAIADKYNVSVGDLKRWNKIKGNQVVAGKSLRILSTERIAVREKARKTDSIAQPKKESIAAVTTVKQEETPTVASYVVQPGDNLSAIAKKFHVSVADLKTWNNFEDNTLLAGTKLVVAKPETEDQNALAEAPATKDVEYVVQRGDFLGIIARKNDVTVEQIKEWNALTDNNVKVGQKLIVGKVEAGDKAVAENVRKESREANRHYLVRKGDSLFSIAKKYPGITVSDIKRWNGIKNEQIKPGMKLKING